MQRENKRFSVKYSICSTIFNNANRVERTLNLLMKAFEGKNFEMIIVDSYSTDGSFEILQKYARQYPNIKILRKKCSRGLGRQIAFENSKGEIAIFVDMDTWYEPKKLSKLVEAWEKSKYRQLAVITMSPIWICPRAVVEEIGGWRNFNAADDIDFMTRLFVYKRGIFVPVELAFNEPSREIKVSFLGAKITLFGREKRYAKSFLRFILRKWKDTIDSYSSCDYTLRKLFLRYRYMKAHLLIIFFFTCLLTLSKFFNLGLKRPAIRVDENLFNNYWVNYQMLKNMVNPAVFSLKPVKSFPSFWEKDLLFISQFYPETKKFLESN